MTLRFKDTDVVNYPQLCSQATNLINAAYENAIFAHAMICSLFIPRPVCLIINKNFFLSALHTNLPCMEFKTVWRKGYVPFPFQLNIL